MKTILSYIVYVTIAINVAAKPKTDSNSIETNIDNLIAVVQVFRHGERSPVSFTANDQNSDPNNWPDGLGQLTNTGKSQQYALGTFTRRRYGDFLPKKYNNSFFRVQTTDVDRTHMSAQANVAAIFPPAEDQIWNENLPWSPIPIHPISEIILNGGMGCPKYLQDWTNALVTDPLFAAINSDNEELYRTLTELTGSTINTVMTASSVYDSFLIEELFGLGLPAWSKDVYPEPVRNLSGYSFLSMCYTDDQKKLMVGAWFSSIIEYFENIYADPTSAPKYQIFSAHDATVASVLNTLGAFEPHAPAFASSIWFELRNKNGKPVINVWHKNNDDFNPVSIKNCGLNCHIEDFKYFLKPWLVTTDEWNEICQGPAVQQLSAFGFNEEQEIYNIVYKQAENNSKRKKGKGGVSPIII